MKKLSAKQVMTYVLLIGLLVLLAVYYFVYLSYNDKAEAIENSNRTLQERVDVLKGYYDNMETYQAEITVMQKQVNTLIEDFPADVKEEDIIVLALDTEENAAVGYRNINIGDREAIKTIPAATVLTAGMENLTQDLIFVERKTSYVNETDYFNMKEVVQTINDSRDRLCISQVAYSQNDESGLLEGTVEVTFYSALGTGKEYIPQDLPEYESGLFNLFGVTEAGETEDAE